MKSRFPKLQKKKRLVGKTTNSPQTNFPCKDKTKSSKSKSTEKARDCHRDGLQGKDKSNVTKAHPQKRSIEKDTDSDTTDIVVKPPVKKKAKSVNIFF